MPRPSRFDPPRADDAKQMLLPDVDELTQLYSKAHNRSRLLGSPGPGAYEAMIHILQHDETDTEHGAAPLRQPATPGQMRLAELASERRSPPKLSRSAVARAVSTAHQLRELREALRIELREELVAEMEQSVREELRAKLAARQKNADSGATEEWREACVESNKEREALEHDVTVRDMEIRQLRHSLAEAQQKEDAPEASIADAGPVEAKLQLKAKIITRLQSALARQSEETRPWQNHCRLLEAQLAKVAIIDTHGLFVLFGC